MIDEASLLLPGERIDDLQFTALRIIQSPDAFRFGMDAVLLADFARVKNGMRVCDLGTGTGILPLLLSARADGLHCDAVEIQPDAADRAKIEGFCTQLAARIAADAPNATMTAMTNADFLISSSLPNDASPRLSDGLDTGIKRHIL